ncbi:MAG: tetratricopeptide repeat protein [Candidatus Brocadiae bacterium]|nr:tetratricopeptide repeat protein [Candidatus Brocadiia bacterium]
MALGHRDRARILGSVAILGAGIVVSAWIWHVGAPEGKTASDAPPRAQAEQFHIVSPTLAPPEALANNLGVTYATRGEYDRAIAHFELAISHNEDYLPGYKNLLAACVETERWDEALKAARKAEELHPLSGELKAAMCRHQQ